MGHKVRIEFEEVAGYPQEGTVKVWVDEKETTEVFSKMRFIRMLCGR